MAPLALAMSTDVAVQRLTADVQPWPGAELFAAMKAGHMEVSRDGDAIVTDCTRCLSTHGLTITIEPPSISCSGCSMDSAGLARGLYERAQRWGKKLRPAADKVSRFLSVIGSVSAGPQSASKVMALCMADVIAEPVNWLWPGRAVAGALNVLDGQVKLGKSSMLIDLVARVTTGQTWPAAAGTREPRDVVLIGHEESPKHTIRPRLDAAGADAHRVHLIQEIRGRMPELPADVDEIERFVVSKNAAVLIFDPISSYVGGIDIHRDNEVRNALMPLAAMAERTGVAVFLIRHVRKSTGGDAINRGLGSIGISAVARNVMMLLKDPDDDDARILTWPGMNVGPMPASLRWRFEGGGQDQVPTIAWDKTPVNMTAQDILDKQEEREHPALSSAEDFVRNALASGPMRPEELEERGKPNHAKRTIVRARKSVGAIAFKKGNTWWVGMPGDPRVPTSHIRNHGSVGRDGTLPNQESQQSQDGQLNHTEALAPLAEAEVIP